MYTFYITSVWICKFPLPSCTFIVIYVYMFNYKKLQQFT